MRFFKIHPNTLSVPCQSFVLVNKEEEYAENMWPDGKADEYVQSGHLIEVVKEKKKK